jgi:hypothetical protein
MSAWDASSESAQSAFLEKLQVVSPPEVAALPMVETAAKKTQADA